MKNYTFATRLLMCIVAALFIIVQAAAQYENYTGAVNPMGKTEMKQKPLIDYSYKYLPPTGREGGENIASAIPITVLPFYDSGNTCDNVNDYDEACPYTGSNSPDVVYSFTPGSNLIAQFDLCNSDYDTKIYIYENNVDNLIACNDDYYFDAPCFIFASALIDVPMFAGNTYYIVIDGYLGDCGFYDLSINTSCTACFSCSSPEGEPDIQDGGIDVTNGGCNMPPFDLEPLFTPIQLNQVICGRTNTYTYNDQDYRDTDWYEITLAEAGTLYWSGIGWFPLQLFIISGDCDNMVIFADNSTISGSCEPLTISANLPAGTYYLWAGPTGYNGLPNGAGYNVIATLNAPPDPGFCQWTVIPISNWALYIGIGLILIFAIVRVRKMV